MSPATAAVSRGGRQRSAACDTMILDAVLEQLRERGYAALTVAGVIQRAGVSSATLYRRWATKVDLVVAALATLSPEPVQLDTGSLEGDLGAFLHNVARGINRRDETIVDQIVPQARRDPDLAAALQKTFLLPRVDQLSGILERARERGELTTVGNPLDTLSLVTGPLMHCANVQGQPLSEEFVERAVAHAVRGLRGH
jgi:AcrR family transcriptional regulator